MKVLTAAEMREVDRLTSERFGIPSSQLMEAAGTSVANVIRREMAKLGEINEKKVCVLCGKGNNGGDGLVAARSLRNDFGEVRVFLFGNEAELRGDAAENLQRWKSAGGRVTAVAKEEDWKGAWSVIARADVIVDAMLGTGLRGGASGVMAQAIKEVNDLSRMAKAGRPALIVAVDTPSGLPSDGEPAADSVLCAHRTVTFTAPKVGQLISPDASAAGAIEVAGIGSPEALVEEIGTQNIRWIEPREFSHFPLIRAVDSNKGMYGHALIVAGSLGKSGAAILCSHAALRAGAGLVTMATPDAVLPIVAAAHAECMSEPLASTNAGTISLRNLDGDRFAKMEEKKDVLAVGPGLGQDRETQEFIRKIMTNTELPVILDADGLNAFAEHADKLRERKSEFLAITPHPGEMARLRNCSIKEIQAHRGKIALDSARKWNAHVVLKGSHTIIATPSGQMFVNTSGNPGLAKGGTGDVLTGILAGLTAQFKTSDWARVLALGVYLHGEAAELATTSTDLSGLLAHEVSNAVPMARLKLLEKIRQRG